MKLIPIEEVIPKMNCLIGYCEVFVKHFTYLKIHGIRVPDELERVIVEANEFVENTQTIDPIATIDAEINKMIEEKVSIGGAYCRGRQDTLQELKSRLLLNQKSEEVIEISNSYVLLEGGSTVAIVPKNNS